MDENEKKLNESFNGSTKTENNCESSDEDEQEPGTSNIDFESDGSTDSEGCEKCPICLLAFTQEIGRPKVCQHTFCFPCIDEWSKVMKTCPIDRREFSQIDVFDSLATQNFLRTVTVNENISIKDYTGENEEEVTPCEICGRVDREDVMLLCDGCDKGFHMDCLDPPVLNIPYNNWYCSECEAQESNSSSEESEIEQNEVETADHDFGGVFIEQPQILRTRQSERIRNAILARRSIRGALQAIQNSDLMPSTSRAITSPVQIPRVSRASVQVKRKTPAKRRKRRTRARRVTEILEYDVKDGQKFPTIKRTKLVRGRKRKTRKSKKRKVKKVRKSEGRTSTAPSSIAAGFKFSNTNVYDLQRGRQMAGLTNFNIFEPSNLLDYVPEDEFAEEYENDQRAASTLTQSIVNYTNPLRRKALINKRVLENCTSTSADINILDSILNEQQCFLSNSNNNGSKQKSSTKLISVSASSLAKQTTNDENKEPNHSSSESNKNEQVSDTRSSEISSNDQPMSSNEINSSNNGNENNHQEQHDLNPFISNVRNDTKQLALKKKKKKRTFDMFEDSPMDFDDNDDNDQEDDEEQDQSEASNCPNFSIYDSVNRKSDENLLKQPQIINEENVDLVQMSDDGDHNMAEDIEPAVVRSQPASPDLENDSGERATIEEGRSYTPPIVAQKESVKDDGKDDKDKKGREHKKHKRREMERYNVRERFRDRSSGRQQRDRFGRNRTRSRTRSRSRRRNSRRRSRSPSNNRERSRHKRSRSRNVEKRHRRSYSRSLSRRRDSSGERKHKKGKHKKSYRKSKSRTPSPRYYRDKSPRRRDRSTSEKSKKKKHRNRSKEKSSTHTKEVYASGQNILVSVNFNNQDEKHSRSERSKSQNDNTEPVVDITAKKKINVSSKPVVAIIDLARSPFKELTPEYKKESNVIELSDSENEKQKPTKSPDSTKLYDPFDILNSPNENVSSSQNPSALKSVNRDISNDFTNKLGPSIIKNLPIITNSEENLVSSSSSVNVFDKLFAQPTNKIEVIQNEIIQHPTNASNINTIESPYSPGNDDYRDDDDDVPIDESQQKSGEKESGNLLDELFGSSSPPAAQEKVKSGGSKKSSSLSADPSKYLTKLKRQERVIEEVKLVIKPYYSKRMINKDQYKDIMRKAVPKICHNRTGEINPAKIKHLIDSYVKIYTHKKKRHEPEEIF